MSTIRCFCPSCGVRLSTSGRFAAGETIDCPKCGATFAPPQSADSSVPDWDDDAEPLTRRPAVSKGSKSGGALTLVLTLVGAGILLVGGLAVVGAIVFFRFQSDGSSAHSRKSVAGNADLPGPEAEEIKIKMYD